MINSGKWKIREANGEDLPFIYSTWARSYRYDSVLGKTCRNSVFYPEYNRIMDRILSEPNTTVIVACKPKEEFVIFGYAVAQEDMLHYVFVKEAFWKEGIATSLYQNLNPSPTTITHKTKSIELILDNHPELNYNPFKLFLTTNEGEKK